jgi:hypothetical protein
LPRFASAVLAGALLLLAAAGCAGDDRTRVTLTNDECTYEGPDSVEAGAVAIDLENDSDDVGTFELVRLDPASTVDDLDVHVASEQERIDAGGAPVGLPAFATSVIRLEVAPDSVSVLTSVLSAGEHAVVCETGAPPTSIHATTEFEAE